VNKKVDKIDGITFKNINFFEDQRGFIEKINFESSIEKIFEDNKIDILTVINFSAGTLRGLHLQVNPMNEIKVVRCMQGKIMQFFLDLRLRSKTFGNYITKEVDSKDRQIVTISPGIAHGYQTLVNDTIVFYILSANYTEQNNITINFNDADLDIKLPMAVSKISSKDKSGISIKKFMEKGYE